VLVFLPNWQAIVDVFELLMSALLMSSLLLTTAAGSVLVFLPNWQAIVDVFELLMDDYTLANTLQLYVLHSLLPMQEQQEAFTHAAPGGPVGWQAARSA
jgi:HrpA-like RNA helicase